MAHTSPGTSSPRPCAWTSSAHPSVTIYTSSSPRGSCHQPCVVVRWRSTSSICSWSTFLLRKACLSCTCSPDGVSKDWWNHGTCLWAYQGRGALHELSHLPVSNRWMWFWSIGYQDSSLWWIRGLLGSVCSPCQQCLRPSDPHLKLTARKEPLDAK